MLTEASVLEIMCAVLNTIKGDLSDQELLHWLNLLLTAYKI
jgi:hypothetical protein